MKFKASIDEARLDREWLNHSEMVHEAIVALVEAKRELEEAKNELEVEDAEMSLFVRKSDPQDWNLQKFTEDIIASLVISSKEHQDAAKAVVQAKYKVDMLAAAVTALDHKKRALENLVDLHGMDYFSPPKATNGQVAEHLSETSKREVRSRGRATRAAEEE